MRKWMTLLLSALLAMTSIAVAAASVLAESGRILDGRWLCSNIAGNVTEDTPAELKDDFGLYISTNRGFSSLNLPPESPLYPPKPRSRPT